MLTKPLEQTARYRLVPGADWVFDVDGIAYVFAPFHDELGEGAYRAVIVRIDSAAPGDYAAWEISEPSATIDDAVRRVQEGFRLEFPNRQSRAHAERLVQAMLNDGRLEAVREDGDDRRPKLRPPSGGRIRG